MIQETALIEKPEVRNSRRHYRVVPVTVTVRAHDELHTCRFFRGIVKVRSPRSVITTVQERQSLRHDVNLVFAFGMGNEFLSQAGYFDGISDMYIRRVSFEGILFKDREMHGYSGVNEVSLLPVTASNSDQGGWQG